MGVVVAQSGKLRRPGADPRASEACRLCDDWPAHCDDEFVCSVCGRTLQTCSQRVGGFGDSPDSREICVTCWEREAVLSGLLPIGWEIEGTVNEHQRRQARQRAEQLQLLMEASDGPHTDG